MQHDGPPGSSSGRVLSAVLGTGLIGLAGRIAVRNLGLPTQDGWIFWVPVTAMLATMGALCWWSVAAGQEPAGRETVRASWVTGLGPLLGILLAGPLGFVAGAVGSAFFRSA